MLKILGVNEQFNSLNWFDSVATKLATDKAAAESKLKVKKSPGSNLYNDDENEAFEEELNIKRIEASQKEFSLLYYTLTSSAILFKEI